MPDVDPELVERAARTLHECSPAAVPWDRMEAQYRAARLAQGEALIRNGWRPVAQPIDVSPSPLTGARQIEAGYIAVTEGGEA